MTKKSIRLTDRKRAAIMEAAVREFRERGFRGANMDRISESAQVSKRTVYNHFASKELLFQAIMGEMLRCSFSATERPYEPDVALQPQLLDIARREIELLADPDFIALAQVGMSESLQTPEFLKRLIDEMAQSESGTARWIRLAAEDGRLKVDDVGVAAEQFVALIKAFGFWPQVLGMRGPLDEGEADEVARSAVGMFLAFYVT